MNTASDHAAESVDPTWLAAIAGWLPNRRWFAGKQLTLRSVSADASVLISNEGRADDDTVTLLVVRATFANGDEQRYAVPVGCVSMRRTGLTPDDRRTIARLDDDRLLVDAMGLPATAAVVVSASFDAAERRTNGTGTVRGRPRRPRLSADADQVRVLAVEQSNSSVLIGSSLIAKLVRRLEPGPNPDAELPAHLAANHFEHVPGLAATLELDLPGASQPADVVIVHDAIANDGDLWSALLEQLARELAIGEAFDDRHLQLAQLLGRRTAELHVALATVCDADSADTVARLVPEPFTIEWQRELVQTLRDNLLLTREALAAAVDAGAGDAITRAGAALVSGDPAELLAEFDRLQDERIDSMRIRIHGDLHLGQILSTGDDVVFIDFEGEPGLPIEHRLVKRSPLADVAGLLRSVDYLGRHALHLAGIAGSTAGTDLDRLDDARAEWTRRMSDAIVSSYLVAIAPAHLVPSPAEDAQMLLDLYLLDKGLYEIRYEIANRPEWVGAPLTAVTEMITR